MKLRTTIEKVQADGYEALRHDLEHDALAAHAYQIELSRMRKAAEMTPHTHNRELVLNLLDALDRRADELMREWTKQDEVK